MLKGLSGCGKSTLAKEMQDKNKNLIRVNKDTLRELLHNREWSKKNEKQILKTRDDIIRESLRLGKSVIVDDTNLAPAHERNLKIIAASFGAQFEIIDMTDVDIKTCIERDLVRANSVGSKVIWQMHNQFLNENKSEDRKLDPLVFDKSLPYCVVFDLDGTLAHIYNRSPYDGKSCGNDQVNESVRLLLDEMNERYEVIILSGRNGDSRPETEKWLKDNEIHYNQLHMRAPDDSRKDSVIKEELFNEHIKDKYNVAFIVDDRKQVVDLWRSLGITCLQCAPGLF